MKRLVILVIIFSMMMHCASRIGFLSYLYQQRNDIAYQIGLIAEVPIALCSSTYHFNTGLNIEEHNDDNSTLPPVFSQAKEIILFFQEVEFKLKPEQEILTKDYSCLVYQKKYSPPVSDIFHPPA